MPPTLGYNVMNCEEMDYPSYSYFLSPILFVANLFSWYNAFGMAYFLIFPAFYLPQICLKEYVNTLQIRPVIITLYRRLQLLALDYNECYAQVFLPMTMIAVMIGGVSSLFILIRLHSEVPVVGIVFFGVQIVIILGMFNFNFVFGFGGRILAGSRELIKTCGKIEGL
jgi:hypothetical protein